MIGAMFPNGDDTDSYQIIDTSAQLQLGCCSSDLEKKEAVLDLCTFVKDIAHSRVLPHARPNLLTLPRKPC
jgi:hypothetical protein